MTVVVPPIPVYKLKAITCQLVLVIAAKLAVITEVILKATAPEVVMDKVFLDNKAPAVKCFI